MGRMSWAGKTVFWFWREMWGTGYNVRWESRCVSGPRRKHGSIVTVAVGRGTRFVTASWESCAAGVTGVKPQVLTRRLKLKVGQHGVWIERRLSGGWGQTGHAGGCRKSRNRVGQAGRRETAHPRTEHSPCTDTGAVTGQTAGGGVRGCRLDHCHVWRADELRWQRRLLSLQIRRAFLSMARFIQRLWWRLYLWCGLHDGGRWKRFPGPRWGRLEFWRRDERPWYVRYGVGVHHWQTNQRLVWWAIPRRWRSTRVFWRGTSGISDTWGTGFAMTGRGLGRLFFRILFDWHSFWRAASIMGLTLVCG